MRSGTFTYQRGASLLQKIAMADGEMPAQPVIQGDPIRSSKAVLRDMRRILKFDHDKADTIDREWDDLMDLVDQEPIADGARMQIITSISGVKLNFTSDTTGDAEKAETRWAEGSPLRESAVWTLADTYTRGHTVTETTWHREPDGWDWPSLRRIYSDGCRLREDEYGGVDALEIRTSTNVAKTQAGRRQLVPDFVPTSWWVVQPHVFDPTAPASFDDYLILRYPETAKQARGRGAYLKILPEYYFSLHVAQWLKVLVERHGLPSIYAEWIGNATSFPDVTSSAYSITEEKVFNALARMQTAHRMMLPPGFKVGELTTNATGLADMLVAVLAHIRSRMEVGIILQEVTSGSAATLGTQGANVTVSQTFLRLIRSMHFRLAGLINRINAKVWMLNDGKRPAPRATFEDVDPAAEQLRFERTRAAVQDGVVPKEHPAALKAYGLPPWTQEDVAAVRDARAMTAGLGLSAVTSPGIPGETPATVMEEYEAGGITPSVARAQLRLLGILPDEAAAMLAEADAKIASAPPVPETVAGGELTPSARETYTTVNEARAGDGLAPIMLPDGSPDPDGKLSISAYRAKSEAQGATVGDAVGAAVTGTAAKPAATPAAAAAAAPDATVTADEPKVEPVADDQGAYLPPRTVARAAATGLELAGRNRATIQADQRSLALGRLLASRTPISPRQVEQLAAWFQLQGDAGTDQLGQIEWALHGGDEALAWAEAVEEVEEGTNGEMMTDAVPVTTATFAEHHDSSALLAIPDLTAIAPDLAALQSAIPDDAIYTDGERYGREADYHLTIKYGLRTADPSAVLAAIGQPAPFVVALGETTCFYGDATGKPYDVVKIQAESPELARLRALVCAAIPNVETHAEFDPHITLAYVHAGQGQRFVGRGLAGKSATVRSLRFSVGGTDRVAEIPLVDPAIATARAAIGQVFDDLGARLSAAWDASAPPPIRRQIARALAGLATNPDETARQWADQAGGMIRAGDIATVGGRMDLVRNLKARFCGEVEAVE